MDSEKINVLVVEPEKKPYMKEISSELSSLQHEVGGYIQAVYPYDEPVAIICDEEAKLKGSELNRVLRDEDGKIYDVIAGTFLVVGLGEEDFSSLTPEHAKQFKEKFDTPEMFMRLNGKLVVIPMEEEKVKAKKPSVLQKLNDTVTANIMSLTDSIPSVLVFSSPAIRTFPSSARCTTAWTNRKKLCSLHSRTASLLR